jgi:hypothetical protein
MMILALAIIPLLVAPLIFELPSSVEATFLALDWFIWAGVRCRVWSTPLPGPSEAVLHLSQHHRSALRADPVPPSAPRLSVGTGFSRFSVRPGGP